MSYNPKSLFNKIQSKVQATNNQSTEQTNFGNPNILKPKAGETYSLRLLWLPPAEGSTREFPMINSYIHRIWDDSTTVGNKEHKVICPTSQYILDETRKGFASCPICTEMSECYKKGQEGSDSAKELYNKFRRTCMGYVPVYIVSGPGDTAGTVKILQYGKQFKDFFDNHIFGVKKNSKTEDENAVEVEDENLGVDAFTYYDEESDSIITKGYNLIIRVTTKKMKIGNKDVNMPQYALEFSRRLSEISEIDGIDLNSKEGKKYFLGLNNTLKFDKDFYLSSTPEELQEFKLAYISGETAVLNELNESVVTTPNSSKKTEGDGGEDEIPMNFPGNKQTKTSKLEEDDDEPTVNFVDNDSSDVKVEDDIDELLKDL